MPKYEELSPEAAAVLLDIIAHESEPNYWEHRFEGLSIKEESILRGCFGELEDKGMVSVLWGSDIPCEIDIFKDGYMYEKHMQEMENKKKSKFERELFSLLERTKSIKAPSHSPLISDEMNQENWPSRDWINDFEIFYGKYLKNHALGPRIHDILFHRRLEAYSELVSCLSSIAKDEDFITSMKQQGSKNDQLQVNLSPEKYDLFISHANKDKKEFVEELNASLEKLGINIFYDKKALEWGDNWKQRIIEGTQKAEFAIIVISENFFDREWTERELNEFLNRQNSNGQKLILPILHNITIAQLQEKYPSVADIQGISTEEYTCDQIALLFARQLIQRLRLAHIQ